MRFLILGILLAFPVAEIYVLIELAQRYGWWLAVYLVVIGYLGLQLIKTERAALGDNMRASLNPEQLLSGANPVKTLIASARNMFAGVLLLIPGVLTDIVATVLLLIPMQSPAKVGGQQAGNRARPAANDDIIEGEFTEIKEDRDRLK